MFFYFTFKLLCTVLKIIKQERTTIKISEGGSNHIQNIHIFCRMTDRPTDQTNLIINPHKNFRRLSRIAAEKFTFRPFLF